MPDTRIPDLSAASALVGTETFPADDGAADRKVTASQIRTFVRLPDADGIVTRTAWIRAAANRTLTNVATEQKLFDSPVNGRLTLPVGVYAFEALLYLLSMNATSGNLAFDLLGAGTATIESAMQYWVGVDATTPTTPVAQTGSITAAAQTGASLVLAATGTGMAAFGKGIFVVSVAGTIIPSATLVTAAAAVLQKNSFFSCERIGTAGAADVSVGAWA